jgi:hypothetical protein
VCYKAIKDDNVSNIFFADTSGSFSRITCPTGCTNLIAYTGTDFKVSKKMNELPYTIDLSDKFTNPDGVQLTQKVLPDIVFEDKSLDW